uniref:Uncharacterized protein n=1 Tax=Magallana gigas TaxID=29159 RepID=K1P824_MAGGI
MRETGEIKPSLIIKCLQLLRNLGKIGTDPAEDCTQVCLGLLVNLCKDNFAVQTHLKNLVFKPSNLNPMFQSIFNIILKGETGMSRRYGVDLFKEILKDGQIQSTLSK